MDARSGGSKRLPDAVMASAVLLAGLAIGLRGVRAEIPPPPEEREQSPGSAPRLAQPMQFLTGGAENRFEELTALVSEEQRANFRTQSRLLFDLTACPKLKTWMEGRDGQRLERLLAELRGGSREDALAALCLVFRLARVTRWNSGAPHAEHLGRLLGDWLRVWGVRGADDAVLHSATLGATLFYGRVMRTAWNAPMIGYNAASHDRARGLLYEVVGEREGRRTDLGRELELRYPRAFTALIGGQAASFFAAFAAESSLLFPGLDGSCHD